MPSEEGYANCITYSLKERIKCEDNDLDFCGTCFQKNAMPNKVVLSKAN